MGAEAVVDVVRRSVDTDAAVEVARQLIAVDTQNPPGDEASVAGLLERQLTEANFTEVRRVETGPHRANVVGHLRGSDGSPTLVWNGHLDVVPVGDPADWSHPPFGAVIDDGRLWGRGAADMKSAVAALLCAVHGLRAAGVELRGDLVFQGVADEEVLGPLGTAALLREGVHADAAIVGEPTELQPVVAARGVWWGEITTHGRSCHASVPQHGVNAIAAMAEVVHRLTRLDLQGSHPLLPQPTLSVTTISGGTKQNIVPDLGTIGFDRRMLPGETVDHVRKQVTDALTDLPDDVDLAVNTLLYAAPSEIDDSEPIVTATRRARELLNLEPTNIEGLAGTTDARLLCDAGIPAMILGPGSIEQAHTVDEFVDVEQVRQAALLYALTLCEYLGVAEG